MNLNFLFNFVTITDILVILDILKFKGVNNVIYSNCNPKEMLQYHKIFHDNNILAANFDIYKGISDTVLYSHYKIGIIFNTSCSNWMHFNDFALQNKFSEQFKWLVFTDDLISTANKLSNNSILINSDVTVVHKTKNIYELYEVYYTDFSSGVFIIKKVGYWNNGLYVKIASRKDLRGLVVKCPIVITDRITQETYEEYLSKPKKNQVDSLHKLKFYALLNYIRQMFNFSYEFQRTNSWGYTRNGTFDGVVGSLQRREADIGCSPLFFRADRAELTDYIAETWETRQCFILRHPKHPGGFYTIYTRPLTAHVWYCVICLLGFSAVIMCCLLRTKTPNSGYEKTDYSFSLALLFNWSAVCQQGMSVHRSSASVKVIVIVMFIYAVTLYQYYNATIVSTLLREPPKNIRTLKDLLKSNLKAGAEDVLYTKDFFKRTRDPIALKMYTTKIAAGRDHNFLSAERGMELVKKGGFAFHVDSVVAYRIMRSKFTEREICEAHEIPLYPPQKMGFVVRKASPLKEHFTYGVRKLLESGLMRRLQSTWDEPKPACVHTPDASVFSVSIREFSTALLALLGGVIISLVVLFAEIITHRCRNGQIAFIH